jgi:hypothetical protein
MNLQEQISRIQSMMMIEQLTGETEQTFNQIINQPAIIVGDTTEKTHIGSVNLKKDGTIDVKFKNGYTINLSQRNFRDISIKIPLRFKKNK